MISQRKIDANRRNARKSTGPRTEEGKDQVRLNALKHGLTARTVVLPHEDEEAYQQRREAWTKDLNPGGDVAAYLVERAVRISWQLDRADFHERARLAKRILKGPGNRKAARESAVEELIRRLLDPDNLGQADTAASARKRSSSRRKPERETSDDPRELIREAGILGRGVPQAPGRVGPAAGERGRLDRPRRRDLRRDGPSQAPAATLRLPRRRDGRPGRARPLPAPDPPGPGPRRGRVLQEDAPRGQG